MQRPTDTQPPRIYRSEAHTHTQEHQRQTTTQTHTHLQARLNKQKAKQNAHKKGKQTKNTSTMPPYLNKTSAAFDDSTDMIGLFGRLILDNDDDDNGDHGRNNINDHDDTTGTMIPLPLTGVKVDANIVDS